MRGKTLYSACREEEEEEEEDSISAFSVSVLQHDHNGVTSTRLLKKRDWAEGFKTNSIFIILHDQSMIQIDSFRFQLRSFGQNRQHSPAKNCCVSQQRISGPLLKHSTTAHRERRIKCFKEPHIQLKPPPSSGSRGVMRCCFGLGSLSSVSQDMEELSPC